MRKVDFNPNNLIATQRQWWDDWQVRAATATGKVITEWEKWLEAWLKKRDPTVTFEFDPNTQIWGDLKEWMKENVFYYRCAYCETSLIGFFGDAEHHRPKGRVSNKNAQGVSSVGTAVLEIGAEVVELPHPGYFWLAYNWKNLIPSCQWCNQGGGKVDQYPTSKVHVVMKRLTAAQAKEADQPIQSTKWPASYYLAPSDLDLHESPLLLNPLNPASGREPLKHLRFGVRGQITSVEASAMGAETIRVLRLDDRFRTEAREKQQKNIHRSYWLKYADPDHTAADLDNVLKPFRSGEEDYSVAALEYIAISKP